jgi:glyoxylase-like metal-dependent hydrolase (beta-lactamase superfamily II)
MPLPFVLSHINLWALADGDGWAVVDTGIQTRQTAEGWRTLLAGPLLNKPVTRVMVTHMHPDHVGMAGWLTRKFAVPAVDDAAGIPDLPHPGGRHRPRGARRRRRFYRAAGWDEEALDVYRARFGGFSKLPTSVARQLPAHAATTSRSASATTPGG